MPPYAYTLDAAAGQTASWADRDLAVAVLDAAAAIEAMHGRITSDAIVAMLADAGHDLDVLALLLDWHST